MQPADSELDLPARLVSGDLSDGLVEAAHKVGTVSLDCETTGLEWSIDQLRLVQLHVPGVGTELLRVDADTVPTRLASVLEAPGIEKIFHHAMFDLRFMVSRWRCRPTAIKCSKIAAKLLYPEDSGRHSLQPLVLDCLGVKLDKGQQTSNWSAVELSDAQIHYAVLDVLFLAPLVSCLGDQLRLAGINDLAIGCWSHIPTRVELELRGLGDPFTY